MTRLKNFPSADEDAASSTICPQTPQTDSYKLSYMDPHFLMRDELRPVRLQLELLKPELLQEEHGIHATVVIFGGSRVVEESEAQQKLKDTEKQVQADPSDQHALQRFEIAKRVFQKTQYYAEARKLG